MGQFYHGNCGDVLYMTADEFNGFVNKFSEINHVDAEDVRYAVADNDPLVDFAGDAIHFYTLDDGWCDGIYFEQYGEEGYMDMLDTNNVVLLFAERQRNPFRQAYKNLDELKNEYKRKIYVYMPADFDWDAHMGWVQYAVFA